MYILQLFPFISQVLIKINDENVSLSELSLKGRGERELVHAEPVKTPSLGARAGEYKGGTLQAAAGRGECGRKGQAQ